MNSMYHFSNEQKEAAVTVDKTVIHRDIFVIAVDELNARNKAKRKNEDILGQDYKLVNVAPLGKWWN